jgi:hypothetical protein
MEMKKVLIWTNILLLLALFLIILEMRPLKNNFYRDPVLSHLGMTKEKVIKKYGEPDYAVEPGSNEKSSLFYQDEKILFFLDDEKEVVNNMEIYSGKEILGTKIGMTFSEIENILGEPNEKGYNFQDENYSLSYFLGKVTGGMGEVEIWFSSDTEDGKTNKATILWKKYWW